MSTRILYSLTDDKAGMQKQIGCMNGIFQLFDRQNFLSGRRLNGHSHKRLLAGKNLLGTLWPFHLNLSHGLSIYS